MVTKLILLVLVPMAIAYLIGRTRSRDRLPREIYDKDGRRIL